MSLNDNEMNEFEELGNKESLTDIEMKRFEELDKKASIEEPTQNTISQPQPKQEEERGILPIIKEVGKGLGEKIVETGKGIGEIVSHPIEFAKFVGQEAKEVGQALPEAAEGAYLAGKELLSGNQKTYEQAAQAAKSGLLENIPGSTIVPAYIEARKQALEKGLPAPSPSEFRQQYENISRQREEEMQKSPIAATLGEVGGLALASSGGKLLGETSTIPGAKLSETIEKLPETGKSLQKIGETKFIETALKPTAKEIQKINKINPEAGKTLLDEGIIGKPSKMLEQINQKLAETGPEIGRVLNQADTVTEGKFLPKKDILDKLSALKLDKYSTTALSQKMGNPLNELIEMVKSEPGEFLSAKQLQDYKEILQHEGFPGTTLLDKPVQKLARQSSGIFKEALQERLISTLPDEQITELYKKHSNLSAAKAILEKKHDIPWVGVHPITTAVGGAVGGPTGIIAGAIPQAVKKLSQEVLPQAASRGQAALGKAIQSISPETLQRLNNLSKIQQSLVNNLVSKGIDLLQAINMVQKLNKENQ